MTGKVRSRTAAAIRAVGASYLTRALTIVISFVVTPIVLGYIGRDLYGFWVIVGSVIGYVGMVDFGVTGSVGTLIARQQGNIDDVNRIAVNALVVHLGTGVVALLLAGGASVFAPPFLNVPVDQHHLIAKLILLAGAGLALSFPVQTLKAVLRGTQRIATLRIVEFLLMLGRTGLILFLLFQGHSIMALPLSTIASSLLGLVVFFWLTARKVPGFRMRIGDLSTSQIGPILSVSAWWFLGNLGALFIYQTDNIVLGKFLGSAAVTTYALTFRVPELVRGQIYQLNMAVAPGVGDLVGRGETERLRELFVSGTRIVLFLGISAAVMIVKFNRGFVTLWVGEENYGGDLLTVVFSSSLVYLVMFHLSSIILTNFLDLKVLATTRFIEGSINLVLSLVFVQRFGMLGVAVATLLTGLLTSAWFLPMRVCNILGLESWEYWRPIVFSGGPFLVVAIVGCVFVPGYGEPTWFGLGWRGFALGVWLCIAGWSMLLPKEEIRMRLRG